MPSVATNANLPLLGGNLYGLTIAGQVVNVVQGTLDVINEIGQRSTGTVQVWTPLNTFWKYGTKVQLRDQHGVVRYSGYTAKDKITKGSRQGHGYLEHQITLMDNCYKADKRRAFGTFTTTPAGTIVMNLLSQFLAAEGVTGNSSTIALGATMTQVIWTGSKSVSEALTWLATQCGFWWNIDSNNVLWFQPYTGRPAPFVLDGTQVSVDSNLYVTYGNDQYVNREFVKGAYAETTVRTETFHGDSSRRNYTLSYEVSSITSIVLDSVTQTKATKSNPMGTAQWYYQAGDPVVLEDDSGVVLTSGDTLTITYKGRYPIIALAANPSLISAQKAREGGGTGYVESQYSNAKLTNQQAAFQTASALLAHFGTDMTQIEFDTLTSGLQEGQMLTVDLPDFGLSGAQMLVNMVEITDSINEAFQIWYHVTAIGSPYEAAQWQTFWQSLMNQSSDPTDLEDVDDASGLALLFESVVTLPYPSTVPAQLPLPLPLGTPMPNPLQLPLLIPAVPEVVVTKSTVVCPILTVTLPFVLC